VTGPVLDEGHFRALRGRANVHLHGPVARSEVVGLVGAADVGLIPHVSNSLTQAMSPLKLSRVPGRRRARRRARPPADPRHRSRVIIEDELSDAIATALQLGRADEAQRRRFAEANSWSRRQEQVVELALAPEP